MRVRMFAVAIALAGCLSEPSASVRRDSGVDSVADSSGGAAVTYVRPLLGLSYGPPSTQATLAAAAPGNAFVFQLATVNFSGTQLKVNVPGWKIDLLAMSTAQVAYGAIAPNTDPATFTFTTGNGAGTNVLADEFTGNDPTGGTTTFDAVAFEGTGNCTAALVVRHAGDALWAACTSQNDVTVGSGFTAGASDSGNFTEWKIATAAVNATETMTFTNTGQFAISATSIKPLTAP